MTDRTKPAAPNWPRDWFAANAPMPVPSWFMTEALNEIADIGTLSDLRTYSGDAFWSQEQLRGQLTLRREVAWRWHYADEMMRQRGAGA